MNEFIARNGIIAQNNSTISGSLTVTAGITGSIFGSSSYAATSSYANNFTVAGTLTAQTLVVQTITSSVIYSSGSNVFGNSLSNTQVFTGSLYQTGSVAAFMGSVGIGTTSPIEKLSVAGNVIFGQGLNRPVTYDSNGGNFKITANSGGWATGYLFNGSAGTYKGGFGGYGGGDTLTYFWIGDDYNTPTIVIQGGQGKVGIGTATPSQKLEVNGGDALIRTSYIGNISDFGTNYASFSHIARTGSGDYSFLSSNAGITFINAKASNSILFRINNLDKVAIDASGNVGIATTSPSQKLDVIGQAAIGSGAQAIVGTDGTYAGYSTIGFGGTTNGYNRVFGNAGTADGLYLTSATGRGIQFWTNGTTTTRMIVTEGGNVGIATTAPQALLDVGGGDGTPAGTQFTAVIKGTSSRTLYFDGGGSPASVWWGDGNSPQFAIDSISGGGAAFWTNNGSWSERMRITSAGNVGIGSTTPTQGKLVVNGGVYATSFTGSFSGTIAAPGSDTQVMYNSGGVIAGSGNLLFNGSRLQSSNYSVIAVDGAGLGFWDGVGGSDYSIWMSGANNPTYGGRLTPDTSGNDYNMYFKMRYNNRGFVFITGDNTPHFQITNEGAFVLGTLTATVKSFVIDHPTKANKKLQYGVLEGPEHSVYIRGRLKNTKYITLPDYWHSLVHEDSITVNITAIGRNQDIWVEQVNEHEIIVGYEGDTVEYFYTVFAERKDVDKLITEFDKEI